MSFFKAAIFALTVTATTLSLDSARQVRHQPDTTVQLLPNPPITVSEQPSLDEQLLKLNWPSPWSGLPTIVDIYPDESTPSDSTIVVA